MNDWDDNLLSDESEDGEGEDEELELDGGLDEDASGGSSEEGT